MGINQVVDGNEIEPAGEFAPECKFSGGNTQKKRQVSPGPTERPDPVEPPAPAKAFNCRPHSLVNGPGQQNTGQNRQVEQQANTQETRPVHYRK
jgi:hypothetical protein